MSQTLPTSVLGRTGLEVTQLGYGAMAVSEVHEDTAKTVLNSVLDAGINFIDTSIDYGRSEEFIGRYISLRRSEYLLASKCGCAVVSDPSLGRHVFTRENIVAGVDQSLARMKTDYLDFVQFHGNPSRATLEQDSAIDTLKDIQKQGKVRFLGSSSYHPNITAHLDMGVFDEFQIPYSALDRGHEDVITETSEAGIGTVIRGGLAQGEPGQGHGKEETWRKFEKARLDDLREEGESRSVFVLRFTLAHPGVDTIIAGTKNPDHLRKNVEASLKGPLSPETYTEAKHRLNKAVGNPATAT